MLFSFHCTILFILLAGIESKVFRFAKIHIWEMNQQKKNITLFNSHSTKSLIQTDFPIIRSNSQLSDKVKTIISDYPAKVSFVCLPPFALLPNLQ